MFKIQKKTTKKTGPQTAQMLHHLKTKAKLSNLTEDIYRGGCSYLVLHFILFITNTFYMCPDWNCIVWSEFCKRIQTTEQSEKK